MKEKEGAGGGSGALRREIWFHPGGRKVTRTTTAATASEAILAHSDLEELAQLTSVEVRKILLSAASGTLFLIFYIHSHHLTLNI